MQEECISEQLTKKDFVSNQEVKWCPGCGDYAILRAMQAALPELNKKKEDFVFVSGIGCSSRFPYYMNTYGFHTIHGRAAVVAAGVKMANSKLSVWNITGDGDALAIGGNHFIHVLRRNVDINIILFNNEIYGLTKGQYSPTTAFGSVTRSSPHGTIESPFVPCKLATGAGGTFVARVVDTNPKMMTDTFIRADQHIGTSFIEVLQNCVIFHDKIHAPITSKETKDDAQLWLEHGRPMLFGANKNKGLKLDGFELEVVTIGENGITEKDILIHDAHNPDPTLHLKLSLMKPPVHPMALGVIREVELPAYNITKNKQIEEVRSKSKVKTINDLFYSGETWEIK